MEIIDTTSNERSDLAWRACGSIDICERGWPLFPNVGNTPGLYRLLLHDGSCYVGQAEGIYNRLLGYRRPTQGVIGEYLMHHALIRARGGKLEIFTDGDLRSKEERQRLERLALGQAKATYRKVHNGRKSDVDALLMMISFHQAEIARLQLRLQKLEGATNV